MPCCGILKKLKAAIKAIYQRVVFKYACVYNKSIAWQRYYFLPREINKRKSNKLIFEGDSVEASVAAFKASSLTWSQWADVAATPDVQEDEGGFKQVGGHKGAFEGSDDKVKKLADEAELSFYEFVQKAAEKGDPGQTWPALYAPKFYGTDVSAAGKKQIVIENLLQGYKHPCIMDLKIGTETVADDAKTEKIFRMMKRDVANGSALTGVRLIALSTFHPLTRSTTTAAKTQAEAISGLASLENILSYFVSDGDKIRIEVAAQMLAQLEHMLATFERQKCYAFIGSSLLFVFEGNPLPAGEVPKCSVRMIDFAHVSRNVGKVDAGYVTGLRSLVGALKTIVSATHLHDHIQDKKTN